MDCDVLQSVLDDLSQLLIPFSQISFDNKVELGVGGYGVVFLALLSRSPAPPTNVAVKQLRIGQVEEDRRRTATRLARELKVWAKAKHPNILELVGISFSDENEYAYFVSAHMTHGNVKEYIQATMPSAAIRLKFVNGITSGIHYLHNCDPPICHGDLKPSNVLVNNCIDAVLCDFGLATFVTGAGLSSGLTTSRSVKGSTRYMSPELIEEGEGKHTFESDIWAWACTAFEVITDCVPYPDAKTEAQVMRSLIKRISPGSVDLLENAVSDPGVLSSLKSVIRDCWSFHAGGRPSSPNILNRLGFLHETENLEATPVPGGSFSTYPMAEGASLNRRIAQQHPPSPDRFGPSSSLESIPEAYKEDLSIPTADSTHPFPSAPQAVLHHSFPQDLMVQAVSQGHQVSHSPTLPFGPGSDDDSSLIDPCNLFIKNLDPNIGSYELFTSFSQFGQILSARVVRTEIGQSRCFGFVSYQTPDQASSALNAMDGTTLGTKPIIVQLHRPKQLRQKTLASRYSSGGRNPHPTDPGETQSPVEHVRRSYGSYYWATPAEMLGVGYEDLSALSPVVRKEVITGELTRQLKSLDIVPSNELDSIAESLSNLALSDVVEAIRNNEILREQVEKLKSAQPAPPASAPEHPSTPLSATGSLSDPRRTSSPLGSLLLGSEKDKLLAAVSRVGASNAAEITNLLMSLSKKERALCLFNHEYLKNKVAEVSEADDEAEAQSVSTVPTAAPTTPAKSTQGLGSTIMSPQTSAISLNGTSAAATLEVPGTPAIPPAAVHTLASLARLPAKEIIKLANSPNAAGLPLAKADPKVVKTTDKFIDSLDGQSEQQKKQIVGTKLFKAVKAFGIRNAKITIHLLDTEDLRALTHLMNSYPSVLKEKVQQTAAATAAK